MSCRRASSLRPAPPPRCSSTGRRSNPIVHVRYRAILSSSVARSACARSAHPSPSSSRGSVQSRRPNPERQTPAWARIAGAAWAGRPGLRLRAIRSSRPPRNGRSGMAADALLIYGTDEPLPEERTLGAGPLTAIFTGGALRSIKVRGVEVIRGLAFLVRDRNWGTLAPALSDVRIEEGGEGFSVSFTARGSLDGAELAWEGRIEASPATGLAFSVRGTPAADLTTCRTGFVILHPLERVVGCPAVILHSDGREEATPFPDLVDPIQPFLDVRAITHEPIPGVRATCRMEGPDPYETEDHRNWLDASFKTYYRPLTLPWPYVIPAGSTIDQAVRLTFEPSLETLEPAPEPGPVTVAFGDRTGGRMPEVGLACSVEDLDEAETALPQLATLGAGHLACRLSAGDHDLSAILRRFARIADALDAEPRLEVVLPLAQDPAVELDLVATAAASAGLEPASVAVSPAVDLKSYPPSVDPPPSPPLSRLYAAARAAFPGVPLGGG